MSTTKLEGSARERLLAAANELFYEEGVHTVGIDRVIERAGVAKASLYSTFGSKDELVRAYLQGRAEARQKRTLEYIARQPQPRDQLLAIFDLLAEMVAQPQYRGCAFVNASAETARGENKVGQVCSGTRSWLKELLRKLASDCGARDPDRLSRQLALIYDGASVTAAMDHAPDAVQEARALAEVLLDQQLPGKQTKRAR